jgi:hypothetical protein
LYSQKKRRTADIKWSEEVCPETKGFCTLSKTVEIYINVIADAQTSDR